MVPVLVYIILYGILHTYLAGRGKTLFQKFLSDRAYHGLYRLIYNIVAVTSILPVLFLIMWRPGPTFWKFAVEWQPILFLIQLIGIAGFIVSLLQIDVLRFAGITQLLAYWSGKTLPLPSEALQTKGIYSLVRHPLYLFSMLILWPITTMTSAYLALCIGVTGYFCIGSFYEERRMVEYYGQTYLDYQVRVPWLIPFLNVRKQSDREV